MDQGWRMVLRRLYEEDLERRYFRFRDVDIDRTHPLFEEIGSLSVSEFQGAVRFLDRNGLIEDIGEGNYRLTRKGFEVARDSEFRETQSMTNTRIASFTFIIAMVEVISMITTISTTDQLTSAIALSLLLLLLTALTLTTFFKPSLIQKLGG